MALLRSAAVAAAVGFATARLGVDVSQPVNLAAAKCLRAGNVSFGIARAWHSLGTFDPNALTTLPSFAAAGVSADVYLFPCSFGEPPAAQVAGMLGNLTAGGQGKGFGRVWLDIESNQDPACAWKADKAANCAWLQSLVAAALATGVPVGVYTSIHEYELLLADSAQGCKVAQPGVPLWYPHYQTPVDPSFDDFVPFGGWTAPTVKQFYDNSGHGTGIPTCAGAPGVDANWMP